MSKPLIFNSGKQYMSPDESEAVQNFIDNLPDRELVYKRGNKEQIVSMYRYPVGFYSVELSREVGRPDPPDGTFFYKTILATEVFAPNAKKNVRVWVKDVNSGEHSLITGDQWLEFAKGAQTADYNAISKGAFSLSKRQVDAHLNEMKHEHRIKEKKAEVKEIEEKAIEKSKTSMKRK